MANRRSNLDDDEARSVFIAVHEETFPDVVAYCRRRAASIEDADDAVAQVYLVAWRRVEDLAAADKPVAWLIAVARGILSNQRRSNARGRRLFDRLIGRRPRLGVDPADVVIDKAAVEEAYEALASLPTRDLEILVLATLEGLSYDEISTVLDERPSVVRTRLYRARKRFTKTLEAKKRREEDPRPDTDQDEGGRKGGTPPEGQGGSV